MTRDSSLSRDGARGRRRGAAADQLRRHNLSMVLERLHVSGPTSRSALTTATKLNRSTVADLIAELAELGLVEERPAATSTGPGRPSALVQTRPQGAAVLAIEFAVDSVAVATVGIGGLVYNQVRVARPRGRFTPEETVRDVAQLAEPLLGSLPSPHDLAGVGAAVVGLTRRTDGFVHLAPNLGWKDVPLADMLSAELGIPCPVLVANDADLGALAEYRRGSAHDVRYLLYLSGEVGLGCGVIIDGEPMLGTAGYAGEAGHTIVNPGGQACHCGSIGCWETEAGEVALLRHLGLPDEMGHIDEIAQLATDGDAATLAALAEVGGWLGLGIGNLINLFNPDMVVLGGVYERLYAHLQAPIADAVTRTALAAPAERVTIGPSALGPDSAVIGAAELALSEVIADPGSNGRRKARRRRSAER